MKTSWIFKPSQLNEEKISIEVPFKTEVPMKPGLAEKVVEEEDIKHQSKETLKEEDLQKLSKSTEQGKNKEKVG